MYVMINLLTNVLNFLYLRLQQVAEALFQKHNPVNPQACARYLIWKELITYVVTSRVHTEVVFSIPEEFLFPILQFSNELPGSPAFTTCSTKVK